MPERRPLPAPARLLAAGTGAAFVVISALTWWRCPFHALTGWYCPGCGATRAATAVMHGDVQRALQDNALLPLAGVALLVGMLPKDSRLATAVSERQSLIVTLALVLTAFYTVARNSFAPWLAPVA